MRIYSIGLVIVFAATFPSAAQVLTPESQSACWTTMQMGEMGEAAQRIGLRRMVRQQSKCQILGVRYRLTEGAGAILYDRAHHVVLSATYIYANPSHLIWDRWNDVTDAMILAHNEHSGADPDMEIGTYVDLGRSAERLGPTPLVALVRSHLPQH